MNELVEIVETGHCGQSRRSVQVVNVQRSFCLTIGCTVAHDEVGEPSLEVINDLLRRTSLGDVSFDLNNTW